MDEMTRGTGPVRVGVLTISDRCAAGTMTDLSGPAITNALPPDGFQLVLTAIVPDSRKSITETLRRWCDEFHCDVVLTTGGTGFSPRDVTPEATRRVLERTADNLAQLLLLKGIQKTPFAALSRGVCGTRGRTLIVNLPGSPGGAQDGVETLLPLLPHLVEVLRGHATEHPTD